MANNILTQAPIEAHLEWRHGDPVSLAFTVEGASGWAFGTYEGQVRADEDPSSTKYADLLVTVTVNATNPADADVTLQLGDSSAIPSTPSQNPEQGHWWEMRQVSGVSRMIGRVMVRPGVVA